MALSEHKPKSDPMEKARSTSGFEGIGDDHGDGWISLRVKILDCLCTRSFFMVHLYSIPNGCTVRAV